MNGNCILSNEERNDLVMRVADFTLADPRRLRVYLPREHFLRIPTDPVPEMYGFNVVSYCERNAWVMKPGLLIKLLKPWQAEQEIDLLIQRIRQIQPPQYHPANRPWDTCLVHLEIPFISRNITREAIERFQYPLKASVNPAGVRVLVVNGPPQSGKTFTFGFIRYVNAMFGIRPFEIAMADYKNMPITAFGPAELISVLLDQVNPEWQQNVRLPVWDAQQPARWTRELCRILVEQVAKVAADAGTDKIWFLVLDGFDAPRVPQQVIECIQYLADLVVGREGAGLSEDKIRLVLLGFTAGIPDYNKRVRTEPIAEPEAIDLQLYFKCYADYRGVALTPEALDALVQLALNDQVALQEDPADPEQPAIPPEAPLNRIQTIARRASLIAKSTIVANAANPAS